MTMQIVLNKAGDIVLASDTKWSTDYFNPKYAQIHDEHGGSKILISPTKPIAISCSGDMIRADEVARKIIDHWDYMNEDMEGTKLGQLVSSFTGPQFECLVACLQPDRRIIRITYPKDDHHPYITPANDRLCAGDQGNPAKFWHLRYYNDASSRDDLMRLAAQLIVDAAHLNTGSIGGLEIVFSENGIFKRLPASSCEILESEAKTRSEIFKNLIFPVAQIPSRN